MRKQIITAVLVLFLVGSVAKAQEPDDWAWVNEHFFNTLEEFMPIKERLGLSLGYRSYRDLYTNELEYSFVFNWSIQEKYISVTVRQADSVSLYDQIMALHRKNPTETIESIKQQLKVKSNNLTEQTCPVIRTQYDEFYRLSLPMLSEKDRVEQAKGTYTIYLHPRVHTLKAHISGGDLQLVITEQEHPFVKWAAKTREALEQCISGSSKTRKRNG